MPSTPLHLRERLRAFLSAPGDTRSHRVRLDAIDTAQAEHAFELRLRREDIDTLGRDVQRLEEQIEALRSGAAWATFPAMLADTVRMSGGRAEALALAGHMPPRAVRPPLCSLSTRIEGNLGQTFILRSDAMTVTPFEGFKADHDYRLRLTLTGTPDDVALVVGEAVMEIRQGQYVRRLPRLSAWVWQRVHGGDDKIAVVGFAERALVEPAGDLAYNLSAEITAADTGWTAMRTSPDTPATLKGTVTADLYIEEM